MLLLHWAQCLEATAPQLPDFATMSQQSLMELFVAGIGHAFKEKKSNFLDFCDWTGVVCDENGDVAVIKWDGLKSLGLKYRKHPRHFIDFRWVPRTVQHLEIRHIQIDFFDAIHLPSAAKTIIMNQNSHTKVAGVLDTESLPTQLKHFDMGTNVLEGGVDCTALPQLIENFSIDRNRLRGALCLTQLPSRITAMFLHENSFSGEIDLSKLPKSLRLLTLFKNNFVGSVWLDGVTNFLRFDNRNDRKVPAAGRRVYISENGFSGELRFRGEQAGRLVCSHNRFTAVDWRSMGRIMALDARDNAISGTLNFMRIPPSLKNINLSNNAISGTLRLEGVGVERLYLENNQLEAIHFDLLEPLYHLQHLNVVNNRIVQKEVQIGDLWHDTKRIDMRGNDIGRCVNASGAVETSDRVLYDSGTPAQRSGERATVDKFKFWLK